MPNDPMERVKGPWPGAVTHWIAYDDSDPFGLCQIWNSDEKYGFLLFTGEIRGAAESVEDFETYCWNEAANHPTVVDYWKEREDGR